MRKGQKHTEEAIHNEVIKMIKNQGGNRFG
jgi:hypothetical protein